jgi:ParB-like chromosome segregation protein Spo0J
MEIKREILARHHRQEEGTREILGREREMTTTTSSIPPAQQQRAFEIKILDGYANLVSPLTREEFRSLVEDIKKNGQLVKGVVNPDGFILDGHHRYHACKQLGIDFDYDIRHRDTKANEILFIVSINKNRRHMTTFQKAELALKAKEELEKLAKQNMSLGGKGVSINTPLGRVDDKLAKEVGIGQKTLYKAEKILQTVKENPDKKLDLISYKQTYSELLKDTEEGKITTDKAYNIIKKDQEWANRKAEIEEAAKGLNLPHKVLLLNKDSTKIEELTEIKDNSVDLIVTDPPYSKESLPLYEALAKLASRKLKEGGSVVFYFGQYNLRDVLNIFVKYENFSYFPPWQIAVEHTGPIARIHPLDILVKWKPMLWFVKGKKRLTDYDVLDYIKSSPPDKGLHKWAQSSQEAEHAIKLLTINEHSLVVDPFLGSGTFAIPAIKMNKYFIGIEIDPQKFENAQNYLKSKGVTNAQS